MDEYSLLKKIIEFGDGWTITNIRVNKKLKEIDLELEYSKKTCFYSKEEPDCVIYDYGNPRRIRHLNLFDHNTYLNFRTPRVRLSTGQVRVIPLMFVDERVSFTFDFEKHAIAALLFGKNKTRAAEFLRTSFEVIHNIMGRAVKRGLSRRNLDDLRVASLDEKSVFDGHNYITVLSDPKNKRILDIIEGRTIESTAELIQNTLTQRQQENITDVTMDMWTAYMNCVKEMLPNAAITHDKFHISKYLNKAVDEVRKEEVKKIEELKRTKYLLLKDKRKWTETEKMKFDELNQTNLKTSQAWRTKENFKGIYDFWNPNQCANFFKNWYINVLESDIKKMIDVAETLLRHLEGIINAAVTTLSNAMAENINGEIQLVKSTARGFKNINGYRNALLFFNGKLDLLPL